MFASVCGVLTLLIASNSSQEIGAIAAQVANSIARPAEERYFGDRDAARFRQDLNLASVWPRPEFREPLLKLLGSDDVGTMLSAAYGLLRFENDSLTAEVSKLKSETRVSSRGSVIIGPVGKTVTEWIESSKKRLPAFVPAKLGLLPDDEEADSLATRPTVPAALADLKAADPSIRLQAFLWLARAGVVIDCGPLEDLWPQMTDSERVEVLIGAEYVRYGRSQLREALERLLANPPGRKPTDEIHGQLMLSLSELGSKKIREPALRIIDSQIDRAAEIEKRSEETAERSLLHFAFAAFGRSATKDDAQRLLTWSGSKVKLVRSGGLFGLAGLDEAEAVVTVLATLSEKSQYRDWPVDAWQRLRDRQWGREEIRWRFIREFVGSLERVLEEPGEMANERISYPASVEVTNRIKTLEAIARVSNGSSGAGIPSLSVDRKTARETARRWREWLLTNDKQPK